MRWDAVNIREFEVKLVQMFPWIKPYIWEGRSKLFIGIRWQHARFTVCDMSIVQLNSEQVIGTRSMENIGGRAPVLSRVLHFKYEVLDLDDPRSELCQMISKLQPLIERILDTWNFDAEFGELEGLGFYHKGKIWYLDSSNMTVSVTAPRLLAPAYTLNIYEGEHRVYQRNYALFADLMKALTEEVTYE